MDDLGLRLDTTTGADYATLQMEADASRLEAGLRLVAEILTTPSFTAAEMEKVREPLGLLSAPTDVRAVATPYPGKLLLRYKGVKGRLVYEVYICSGDPKVEADWSLYTSTGKNSLSISDLESGKEYFFRVLALGSAGASPASDVTSAKAA